MRIWFIVLCSFVFVACSQKTELVKAHHSSTNSFNANHTLEKYENIWGYHNDEYVLLYGNLKAYLFDMFGNKYREWKTNIKRAQLLKNCNLMVIDNNQKNFLAEKNYNGEIIWSHEIPGFTHHDFEITDDGHITFFYNKPMPKDFKLTNGCQHEDLLTDVIIEVDREHQEYFKWDFSNYFPTVLNRPYICNAAALKRQKESSFSKMIDRIHPNSVDILQDNKWWRRGFQEFKPGNLIITMHHLNAFMIIDKETKLPVWYYDGLQDQEDGLIDGIHEAKMIAEGLPGAGNIIFIDNGKHHRKYTVVKEINPITKETVWSYKKPGEFFTEFAGSWQRLKNGDTFISDDSNGRVFVVDKKGNIKFQFVAQSLDGEQPWVKRGRLYSKKEFAQCL